MFIQDTLQDLKAVSGDWFPGVKFLIMFIGAVVGPLVLLVVGGRDSGTLSEPGLTWSFLAIATLLLISLGAGFSMFRREARATPVSSTRI